ncbi:MAG: tetratricopeptide repeat protein, partial [Pyrinomonadaceae bacterium]|nr:tetratricopeptide repeat protein [Pyrinomonadaceae bacterium]
ELNVQAVLLGRVVQRGEDLTLNLELVDATTENVLWAEKFDRKMKDLVSLQSEIARDVSNKLRLRLSATEREKVAKTYTANSEAQRLYLRGRFHWNKRTSDDFEKAIVYFKQAIERDPTYPLAYAGLADVYVLTPQYARKSTKVFIPLAKSAAQKAIELDYSLAEPHATLGYVLSLYGADFEGAEREYTKAIELNPKYATAYQWYSEFLAAAGRKEEAIKTAKTALELEPLSLIIHAGVGLIYWQTREPDKAIAHLNTTKELDPNFIPTYQILALAYEKKRMFHQSNANSIKAAELAGRDTSNFSELKSHYERDGWNGVWKQRVKLLTEQSKKTGRNVDFLLAMNYAKLKNKEKTLEYLQRVYDERDWRMMNIGIAPGLEFLKGEPRYEELLRKIGFREEIRKYGIPE